MERGAQSRGAPLAASVSEQDSENRAQAAYSRASQALRSWLPLFEVGIVVLVGWMYTRPFVQLGDDITPGGREFQGNTAWLEVGRRALLDHFELPLWHHHTRTGMPYLGDPLSHFFSPLALIPTLLFGSLDGPRIAVGLTIVTAGLSMYYLAHVLRLGMFGRVFAALIYMMNGHMIARFDAGHFDFGLAFPYLPLCIAFIIQTVTTRRGALYPILTGASLAGLLFAGNVYYFVFALPGFAILTLGYAITPGGRRWLRIDWNAIVRAGVGGAWGAGFSAIQWVPWLANNSYVDKDADRLLAGSPTIAGALRSMFTADTEYYVRRVDGMMPLLHEYYSYIGIFLIPLFLLAPLAVLMRRREPILFGALLVFYLLLASAAHNPFQYVYEAFPRLYDFRHTSRQLALAMPFAAIVAALTLDALWISARRVATRLNQRTISTAPWPGRICVASAGAAIAVFAWLAVADVYAANQLRYHYVPANATNVAIGEFLATDQDRPFLVDHPEVTSVPRMYMAQRELKLARAVWGWRLNRVASEVVTGQPEVVLVPPPRYFIDLEGSPPPDGMTQVGSAGGRAIFRVNDAPPYAGFVRLEEARERPEVLVPLRSGERFHEWPFTEIAAAQARWPSTNQVEVVGAPREGHDMLIVLESYVAGWRLEVDGERVGKAMSVGGLLAAEALPGEHTYLFVFDPSYARYGTAITIGTILGAVLLMAHVPLSRRIRTARHRV